jgi:hypothetical protein
MENLGEAYFEKAAADFCKYLCEPAIKPYVSEFVQRTRHTRDGTTRSFYLEMNGAPENTILPKEWLGVPVEVRYVLRFGVQHDSQLEEDLLHATGRPRPKGILSRILPFDYRIIRKR